MFTALILAATISYHPADFDKIDYSMLSSLVLVSAFDVMSTRYKLENSTATEMDPLLGEHPGAPRLWLSFVASQAIVIFTARYLPDPWRKVFEFAVLSAEIANNAGNVYRYKAVCGWQASFSMSF